jgi:glycosyltransferase involved in cell wall biosynthesis
MSWRPFVSVVIPTYNRAQRTIAAIESVLAQTYPNQEIIVIDDGSTDGSSEAIQRFLTQKTNRDYPAPQIRYINQPNQGPSAARNAGVERARGEYVAFLDSDDVWLPEKLEWQVRTIEQFKNQCGACFTDARLVEDSGEGASTFRSWGRHYEQITGVEPAALELLAKSFCGFWVSTLLVRTELIKRVGGFDPAVLYAEDRDLYFRLSLVTSLAYVNKLLVRADRTSQPGESKCRPWGDPEVRLGSEQRMYEKWLGMGSTLPPDVRRIVRQDLRGIHSSWANWYLETKRYAEARRAASRALKYEVTFGVAVKWALAWLAPTLVRRITAKTKPCA